MTPAIEDRFAAAVGMTRGIPLRVEHADGGILAEGEITVPYAVVGSDPACEITFNDPALPGRAACLQVIDGRITLFPLDTLRAVPLRAGEPWKLDRYSLSRTDAEPAAGWGADPLRTEVPADGPKVTLKLLAGPTDGVWGVNRRMAFVGRSAACAIRLDADGVCDVHAYLLVADDGLWVVDLLSDTGTWVNGERVRVAALRDGDELTIGACRIACRLDLWGTIAPLPPGGGGAGGEGVSLDWDTPDDLVPLAPALLSETDSPLAFDVPETADPAAVALFRYVAAMQGHLMDHFRQSIEGMMAEFGRMQREQMEATQKELARMAELNAELHKLYQQARETPPPSARPLYRPPADHDDPPGEDTSARYQWVAARIAGMEEERTGIWNRLKGLFGKTPA